MKNRKLYMVDRTLQYRLGVELMVIVLLMLVVPLVFFAIFLMENPTVPNPKSGGLLVGLIRYHWLSLTFFYVAYVGITYIFIVYYSHRIAGPVHHFRQVLDDVTEGRVGQQVSLRKGDYFESLGGSINRAAASLASDLADLKTAAAALSEKAAASGNRELSGQAADIQRILDRYTVAPKR